MNLSKFRWEIPDTSSSTSTGHIHRNTKVHLFNIKTGKSVCNKYRQQPLFYDEVEYTGNDDCYCKKCLKKYKKLEERDLDEKPNQNDL